MTGVLFRSGSVPSLTSLIPGSPRVSLSRNDSFAGFFSGEKSDLTSPKISLHLDPNRRGGIIRAASEPDLIRSKSELTRTMLRGIGSQSFPAMIPEEEYTSETEEVTRSFFAAGDWTSMSGYGGGIDQGKSFGGGGGGGSNGDSGNNGYFAGGNADRSKIGANYKEMLKSDPMNALLLRNYAKFLHEVERDVVKAEEYYGRAILASPGDGEVLSLYGKLIWEKDRDEERAKSYFDQAVSASPDDCMVLGSYAQFMWEAEDVEDEEEEITREVRVPVMERAAMVEAF